ncbi:MAG: hypothetical protein HS118_00880 [Bacteroidia bacterium]|nr:hypothetical protein [Bacteroidia bacterium]
MACGCSAQRCNFYLNAWSYSLNDRTKEVFIETGNEIPENGLELTLPRLIPGVSREFILKKFSIAPALDLEMTFDGKRNTLIKTNFASIDPRVGIEAGYNHLIFLRTGISNFQQVTDMDGKKKTTVQPNLGVGIRLKSLSIDYALTNIGNSNNLYSNVFSIRLNIYKQKNMRKLYSLIFILFLSPAVLNAQYANSWINFNGSQPYSAQQYFKIKVWKKGIYRLDYSTLQQAGFNVTQNPHNFQIFHNGTEQYIYVAGEADNTDPTDYIEFYGKPNDGWADKPLYENPSDQLNPDYSLFSDTAVYFLTAAVLPNTP